MQLQNLCRWLCVHLPPASLLLGEAVICHRSPGLCPLLQEAGLLSGSSFPRGHTAPTALEPGTPPGYVVSVTCYIVIFICSYTCIPLFICLFILILELTDGQSHKEKCGLRATGRTPAPSAAAWSVPSPNPPTPRKNST